MGTLELLISALAVWRLAHMIRYEPGPWKVFYRIREKLGDGMLGDLFDCIACLSMWLAIIVFIPGTKYPLLVLAISALVIFLEVIHDLLWKRADETTIIRAKEK